MKSFQHLLLLLLFSTYGCNSQNQSDSSNGSVSGTATTGTSGPVQTVKGDGFSFEAPADWTVLPLSTGVGVTSPIDLANGSAGINVTARFNPVQAPLSVEQMIESLLKNGRGFDIEATSEVTVAGRSATRQEFTSSSKISDASTDVFVMRRVSVYVPLDTGVLVFHAQGPNDVVKSLSTEIDAIIASLHLMP